MMIKIRKRPRARLPALSGVDRAKLNETVKRVESALGKLKIERPNSLQMILLCFQ